MKDKELLECLKWNLNRLVVAQMLEPDEDIRMRKTTCQSIINLAALKGIPLDSVDKQFSP